MNQTANIKGAIGLFVIFVLTIDLAVAHSVERGVQDTRPNILLINIDDLGWKDLGYMGSTYYETPNLDRLARQGMVFSNAYASAANCAPSRAALFSGQYAPRTGVYTVNSSARGASERRRLIPAPNTRQIVPQVVTISEVLQHNGYRTAHIGKWHISNDPTDQGFDINIGGTSAGNPRANGMGGYFSPYNNPTLKDGPKGENLTDRLTSETIAFIRSVKDQPFFINFSPYAVHSPIQPKPELKKKYAQKLSWNGQNNAGYAAMIETMDQNVGRIIAYLKSVGKFKNTFVVFTSDNGGVYQFTKQWPLRAGKGSYFEGGIRVPMVVVWPEKIKPATTTDQSVSNIDFYPTFLEVAGITKRQNKVLDGSSLIPVFEGKKLAERSLFWHFPIYLQGGNKETSDPYFRTRPGSVILQGSWKLHEYFEDGRVELYNLATDVGENKNVATLYPDKVTEMKRKLRQWRRQIKAPVPDKNNPKYQPEED